MDLQCAGARFWHHQFHHVAATCQATGTRSVDMENTRHGASNWHFKTTIILRHYIHKLHRKMTKELRDKLRKTSGGVTKRYTDCLGRARVAGGAVLTSHHIILRAYIVKERFQDHSCGRHSNTHMVSLLLF